MSQLPSLGRLGAQLYTRVLSGVLVTGYRDVNPTAQFIAGTVAKLTTVDGKAVATPVTAVTDTAVGIFWCDKVSTFYRTVFEEVVTLGADGVAVNLQHANLKSGSVRVTKADGTPSVELTDYNVNLVNGTITPIALNNLSGEATCLVSYWYADPNKAGIDNTGTLGKAAVLEGYGEIATSVYDTAVTYTLGGSVYFTAAGILTSASGNGAVKIGTVTKVPSSSDIELYVKVTL